MKIQDILDESGSFSYGKKTPKKGSVRSEIEQRQKKEKSNDYSITDDKTGTAKTKKDIKEETNYLNSTKESPEFLLYHISSYYQKMNLPNAKSNPVPIKHIVHANFDRFGGVETVMRNLNILSDKGWIGTAGDPNQPDTVQVFAETKLLNTM